MTKTPNVVSYHHPSLGTITKAIAVYPSAILIPPEQHYMAALDLVPPGTKCVFCDGETIVIPEYECELIEQIKGQFQATTVQYGQMREHEFATLACRAGVDGHLVVLGDMVRDWSLTASEMVAFALRSPDEARRLWSEQYLASMDAA